MAGDDAGVVTEGPERQMVTSTVMEREGSRRTVMLGRQVPGFHRSAPSNEADGSAETPLAETTKNAGPNIF